MISFHSSSIRRKLMLSIMVTSTIVLVLACAAFVAYDQVTFQRTIVSDVKTLAQIIGATSKGPLSLGDQERLATQYLAPLRAKQYVVNACFYKDDAVLAEYSRPGWTATRP